MKSKGEMEPNTEGKNTQLDDDDESDADVDQQAVLDYIVSLGANIAPAASGIISENDEVASKRTDKADEKKKEK